ncbi:hypothetical protein LEP1GSC047_1176 [Leptospira inadai serovar Lyme str. 10]|uniref:Concanavalin A-like lectin/glucanases family protein n=2 Tax=Leptospira inadai serovar Lyme TaxID=293084 RepID=V6H9Y0_9LEPT|nr:hypothetical protein [Leptospira inadai]EQA35068.1 hypothetical protein LEP1GSC047_1176 [Leptospira inadai serovar Lyme str. 10]PNV75921.1 hypothetical protein BES34_005270 [Leptospira inadai serovar Lyme]
MRKITRSYSKFSLLSLFFLFGFTVLQSETNSFSLSSFLLKDLRLQKSESGNNFIELSPRDRKQGAELFFDFEEEEASDLQDKTGGYRVLSSSYLVDPTRAHTGKRSARFAGKRSGIKISGRTKGMLTSHELKEEFYISLFLLPGTLDKEAVLLTRSLYTRGKKFGWDLKIKDEIPILELSNFFQKEDKSFTSLKLVGRQRISRSKWNHLVVHFRPVQREVILYINGKEAERIGVPLKESITRIGFHPEDTTPFVIGENFYGWLDDFLVAKGSPDLDALSTPYEGQMYDNSSFTAETKFGTAISPIYKTRYTNSTPETLILKAKVPKSSVLEFYFRSSPQIFARSADSPSWKTIDLRKLEEYKEEDLSREGMEEETAHPRFFTYRIPLDKIWNGKIPSFKYYQTKAKFKADADGKISPELEGIIFTYKETLPPVKPMGLKVAYSDDDYPEANGPRVCLSWIPNPEREVRGKSGGYVIHYGVGPNRMVGIIKGTHKDLAQGKAPVLSIKGREKHPVSEYLDPIIGDDSSCPKQTENGSQRLCQCIDNRLISLNAESPDENQEEAKPTGKSKKKKASRDPYDKKLLFLQKGLTFYFKVGAYNSFYDPVTGFDQISPLSEAVEVYFLSE